MKYAIYGPSEDGEPKELMYFTDADVRDRIFAINKEYGWEKRDVPSVEETLRARITELERERDEATREVGVWSRKAGLAEADCAALRGALGNLFTQEIRAVGCVERMVNWLESALVMTQADKALWLKEAHAFLRRKGPTEAAVTAALAQPHPGQALLDRLARAEGLLPEVERIRCNVAQVMASWKAAAAAGDWTDFDEQCLSDLYSLGAALAAVERKEEA